ncbi:translocation/assembly module TamB domain-containing protein [Anaeromusa acidaminophila]|uniref:translocation/assembly module TamB domain-containing protein n=1 Tax=Anaeromusa acidaminophila TaxID=81464 RepID=UPI00037D4A6D|nr:translocation/assembly module TamB domain-containing protein [Anaeromusa acidaminophila]
MNIRRLAKGASVLAAVTLLFFGAIYQWSAAWLEEARPEVVQQLNASLGGELSVGSISLEAPFSVVLRDAELRAAQGGAVLLTAQKIEVKINPLRALGQLEPIKAVSEIKVVQPLVLIEQDAQGKWPWEEFLRQRPEGKSRLDADVFLGEGNIHISLPRGAWNLENLAGSVHIGEESKTVLDLKAVFDGRELTAQGRWNDEGQGLVNLQVPQLALSQLAPLLSAEAQVKNLTGSISQVGIFLRQEGSGRPAVNLNAQLEHVSAEIAGVPVEDVSGMVTLASLHKENEHKAYVALRGKAAGQSALIQGYLHLPRGAAGEFGKLDQLTFELQSKADHVDLASVKSYIPKLPIEVAGDAGFDLQLSGSLNQPQIAGTVTVHTADIGGISIERAEAKLQADAEQLTVASFEGDVAGGLLKGSGWLQWKDQRYRLACQGRNLSLNSLASLLPELGEQGVQGMLSVDGYLEGKGWQARPNVLQGTVEVREGSWQGVAAESLTVVLVQRDGGQDVQLQGEIGGGSLAGAGKLRGEEGELQLFGSQLPLERLQPLLQGKAFSGRADIALQLAGNWRQPQGVLELKASSGELAGMPYDSVFAQADIVGDRLELRQGMLQRGQAEHVLRGSLEWRGQRRLALEVISKEARLEEVLPITGVSALVTGKLENTMQLSGTIAAPIVRGQFVLRDGSFRTEPEAAPYFFSRLSGKYALHEDGSIDLDELLLNILRARLRAKGSMDAQGNLAFRVEANDLELAQIQVHYPYAVSGLVSFSGTIGGTKNEPTFYGELSVPELTLNGQKVKNVQSHVESIGSYVNIPRFSAQLGKGNISFKGDTNLENGVIDGILEVNHAQLAHLLPILNVTDSGVDGRLDGVVRIGGEVGVPSLDLYGRLQDGLLRGYPLEAADIHVSQIGSLITIHRFEAKQGVNGKLVAQGTADLRGEYQLEVGGTNLDAGLLTTWFFPKLPAKGSLDFVAQLSGPADKPFVNLSIGVSKGVLGGVSFDSATALLLIDQKKIEVEQAALASGQYRARVRGTVPVAALRGDGADGPMDLRLDLNEANLGMLPLMLKQVAWAEGPIKGEVRLGGTWSQPLLYGEVEVPKGVIKLKGLKEPLADAHLKMSLEGTTLSLADLRGKLGSGTVTASGQARLQGRDLVDYQVLLNLDKSQIDSEYFKGPVSGKLQLLPDHGSPQLKGNVKIGKGNSINIPLVDSNTAWDWDLGLDVDFQIERGARLYNPLLYDMELEGAVHAGGTLKEPYLQGEVHATRGTVKYLRTPFKVNVAKAEFGRRGTFLPVLHLRAATVYQQNLVLLGITGPAENMELQLRSEPAMSQDEIIKMLTLRGRNTGLASGGRVNSSLGTEQVYDLFSTGLEVRLVSDVEDSLRDLLGLDEFRMVRGYALGNIWLTRKETTEEDIEKSYNVRLGKYLMPQLYVAYTTNQDRKLYTWEAKYELNRQISFFAATNEEKRKIVGIETKIRF